jgi:hypothetical protein
MRVRGNILALADNNNKLFTISLLGSKYSESQTTLDNIYTGQLVGEIMELTV